jgi:cell wall-associated NlpC family hydrolase
VAEVSRAAIAQAARAWLGVRFAHQGRSREGVDCAGLVIVVARELGLVPAEFNVTGYSRRPDGRSLLAHCRAHLAEVSPAAIAAGDVLAFRTETDPQHLALAADYFAGGLALVHAYAPARKVTENRLDEGWRSLLVAAFRFPGVERA